MWPKLVATTMCWNSNHEAATSVVLVVIVVLATVLIILIMEWGVDWCAVRIDLTTFLFTTALLTIQLFVLSCFIPELFMIARFYCGLNSGENFFLILLVAKLVPWQTWFLTAQFCNTRAYVLLITYPSISHENLTFWNVFF